MKIKVMQLGGPMGLYGLERWILALVRYLRRDTIQSVVSVIKDAPGLDAPLIREAGHLGVATQVFHARGRVNFSAVSQLRQYIRRHDIHILHTHGYKQDAVGLLATMGTSCRLMSTPHGWSTDAGPALTFYEGINRAIFPAFDRVLPLSRDLYDELAAIPLMRPVLQLIPNGVDTDEILSHREVAPELDAWKDAGDFVVGFIGQLIRRKGVDILVKALAGLPESLNWKLALIGEGDQRAALGKLASALGVEKNVRFFGFRENRLDYLAGFDLFVLPSKLEGIPRCLMEAMTAGVTAAASNIPGCADLIQDRRTGRLFPVDDAAALRTIIQDIITGVEDATDYASRGRERVMKRFSARRMARDYEQVYQAMVKDGLGKER